MRGHMCPKEYSSKYSTETAAGPKLHEEVVEATLDASLK